MSVRATESRAGWKLSRALPAAMLLGLVVGLLAGCTDEEQVFVERPVFNQPSDTIFGFVGYFDAGAKLTSCGNCHATFQHKWEETGHSDAWAGLQSSDHADVHCEVCHTVSQYGNALTDSAGWPLTQDERYLDVQCESCHGPGFAHVQDPTEVTAPLATMAAGVDLETGCGECHADAHHPFVEQWGASKHGAVPNQGSAAFVERTLGHGPCLICHEGRAALEGKFFETSDYIERDGTEDQPIACIVCHDPHGSDFEGNLRASLSAPTTDNLCVTCHSNRGVPPSDHGPHAAQGLLVLGINVGWLPPGFEIPDVGAHGGEGNEELCATCHVATFTVTQPEFFSSVGHTFAAIACLDAEGKPTLEEDCLVSERDFRACAECHASEDAARDDYVALRDSLDSLLDQLWEDENGDCVMDTFGVDFGVLPLVLSLDPADTTQLDPRDGLVTVAEGAWWNGQLASTSERPCFREAFFYAGLAGEDSIPGTTTTGVEVSGHPISGDGVHNPDLLVELLIASIDAVIDFYSLP